MCEAEANYFVNVCDVILLEVLACKLSLQAYSFEPRLEGEFKEVEEVDDDMEQRFIEQNTSDVTTHKDDKEESQDEDFGDFESTRYAK